MKIAGQTRNRLVNHKTYGKETKPTIYYILGFTGRLGQYQPHIKVLVRLGFRVVAFEYDDSVLNDGNPQIIIGAIQKISDVVRADQKTHKVAGVYGVSLGVFMGLNILDQNNIRTGMFNSGAAPLRDTIWNNPLLAHQKAGFVKNGYSFNDLQKAWQAYEISPDPTRFKDKRLLFMNSRADRTITFDRVYKNLSAWQKAGLDMKLIVFDRLGHAPAIVRNMFRISATTKFFKSVLD